LAKEKKKKREFVEEGEDLLMKEKLQRVPQVCERSLWRES